MASEVAKKLFLSRIATHGISEPQAQALGLTYHDGAELSALCPGHPGAPVMGIPYFDPYTNKPMVASPKWPDFIRYRYMVDVKDPRNPGKPLRYIQPKAGVCAYFPKMRDGLWASTLDNPEQFLIITEGEMKAAKACMMGFPTIGLGGVENYKSNSPACILLPELAKIDWVQRNVIMIYDSDISENANIQHAANGLCSVLTDQGALPKILALPDHDGKKQGLDDWFLNNPGSDLRTLLEHAQDFGSSRALFAMNDRTAWVTNPGCVLKLNDMEIIPPALAAMDMKNEKVLQRVYTKDQRLSYKPTPIFDAWMSWPLRRSYSKMGYEPGKPQVFEENGVQVLNTWEGFATTPKQGDVTPFLELFNFMVKKPAERKWLMQWMAYPIQNPGAKMYSSVTVIGGQGVGKSLLFECLKKVYGKKNAAKVSQSQIESRFNDWADNKQLVIINEASAHSTRAMIDRLKEYISEEDDLNIERKGLSGYRINNHINFVFTSNHADAQALESWDRRHFILDVGSQKMDSYAKLDAWMRSEEGPRALHHFLLNVDTSDFKHRDNPPMTDAKEAMIEISMSPLDLWLRDLREEWEGTWRFGMDATFKDELATPEKILACYRSARPADFNAKVTTQVLGRALHQQGFTKLPKTNIGPGHGTKALYIIRKEREAFWVKATNAQIKSHYIACNGKGA